jgi:hypothetical protein
LSNLYKIGIVGDDRFELIIAQNEAEALEPYIEKAGWLPYFAVLVDLGEYKLVKKK